jgi:hypothetical protein
VISAVPAETPVTIPVVAPTVALALPVLQVPPPASFRVVVVPGHTTSDPVIAPGSGFTVTTAVIEHPVGAVYVIVVVPASTPVAMPLGLTVATLPVLLAHVPPAVASASVVVRPAHTVIVPVMVAGNGLTVITVVVMQPVLKV